MTGLDILILALILLLASVGLLVRWGVAKLDEILTVMTTMQASLYGVQGVGGVFYEVGNLKSADAIHSHNIESQNRRIIVLEQASQTRFTPRTRIDDSKPTE